MLIGRFAKTLPIDCSNDDDVNILLNKLESSDENYDNLAHDSSEIIHNENDENIGKDYSSMLTNLFTEFGEIPEKYIKQYLNFYNRFITLIFFKHRNLMKDSTEEIIKIFFDHEDQLNDQSMSKLNN